jgi:hypothetical protein
MKIWKNTIRVWITITSVLSFLGGWVVLAHSPKPNQFNSANLQQMPALEPVPSLEQITNSQGGLNFINNVRPVRLRTGGSG